MQAEDPLFEEKWLRLMDRLGGVLGKKPRDLNALLFLIGVQELGKGRRNFSKEEKQDLMHIAVCKLLSLSGYYRFEGYDEDGWPHWALVRKLPHADLLGQEEWLKMQIMRYFEQETDITGS